MEQQIEVEKEAVYYNGLSIGSVEAGETASASIEGIAPNQKLNLVLPIGPEGPQGLQGPEGPQGIKGDTGAQGIQGIQGETGPTGPTGSKGDPFTYEDFTPEQLESLRGPKGEQGDPFTYEDFTEEQLSALKGPKGDPGSVENVNYNDLNLKPQINGVELTGNKSSEDLRINIPDTSSFITKEVDNLTNYELKTNTGSSITLNIDSNTFTMTLELKNSAGEVLSTGTIDLPLETMVVNATYDNTTKEVVLTLQSGSTTRFSVADLVSGLAKSNEVYTKQEIDENLNTKAHKKKTGTLTLSVANWTAEVPYTQTINIADIMETDVVNIYPVYSEVIETRATEREDYSKLSMVTSANSSLTFICDEEIPTIDLNLRYEVTY